jgi:ADP-heptose:LPS heptosyltransferase
MNGQRYLLVRFSAIGDCVMAAWAATAIRQKHPEAFLCWAVEGRCAPVVDRHRLVTQRLEFPRDRWKEARWSPKTWREQLVKYTRLRPLAFDYGLDLQGHSKTALCLRLAAPRMRIAAAATDSLARRLNPVRQGRDATLHTVEWNHQVLSTFGDFPLPERPILPAVDTELDERLVTISVSAGQADKAYPADGWRRVAEALQGQGYRIAFLGGRTDRAIDLPDTENYVGKLSLKETLSMVGKSAVHLAADTGTGHMAAGLGTPVVSVFGPTDPQVYRPYTKTGIVLREGRETANVTPEQILEAAARSLVERNAQIPR